MDDLARWTPERSGVVELWNPEAREWVPYPLPSPWNVWHFVQTMCGAAPWITTRHIAALIKVLERARWAAVFDSA